VATVSDTDYLRATGREPRLALGLTLEPTVAGSPSVASLIGVVTMVFELADPDGALRAAVRSPFAVEAAHNAPILALAVVEHAGAPLIISAGLMGRCAAGGWTAARASSPLTTRAPPDLGVGGRRARRGTTDHQRRQRRGAAQLAPGRQPGRAHR